MPSALILNRFLLSRVPYSQWLGDTQLRMITSNGALDTGPAGDAIYPVDSYDTTGEVEDLAVQLFREQPYDHLIALSEYDILRAARLRDLLGLPGQGYKSALAFRDKVIMKDHWARAGLPIAPYAALDTATDLLEFVSLHGFPVVVKPRRGAGSRAVRVLRDHKEMSEWLRQVWSLPLASISGWMAEEFVEGELLHVDGLARPGTLEIAWPSTITSLLAFHEMIPAVSLLLDAGDPAVGAARDIVAAGLKALPDPGFTIFHAEIWRLPDSRFLLNEIASRLGGGKIRTTIAAAFGTDMARRLVRGTVFPGWLEYETPAASPRRPAGFVLVPPAEGTVASVLAIPEWLRSGNYIDAAVTAGPGTTFGRTRASVMDNIATCVATGSSREEVTGLLERFIEWSHTAITYSG